MEWFKKHTDTVLVLSAIIGAVLWMNTKFNAIDKNFAHVDLRFSEVEKEMAVMKTVLIMKGIMPDALANSKGEEK